MTSNLNIYGHSIENLKTPTTNRQAVNKEYVDNNYMLKNSEINMNNHEIFNVKDPTAEDQATNQKYVDTQLATKLDKAGSKKYVNVDGLVTWT